MFPVFTVGLLLLHSDPRIMSVRELTHNQGFDMESNFKIAAFPGDGIGLEVLPQGIR